VAPSNPPTSFGRFVVRGHGRLFPNEVDAVSPFVSSRTTVAHERAVPSPRRLPLVPAASGAPAVDQCTLGRARFPGPDGAPPGAAEAPAGDASPPPRMVRFFPVGETGLAAARATVGFGPPVR